MVFWNKRNKDKDGYNKSEKSSPKHSPKVDSPIESSIDEFNNIIEDDNKPDAFDIWLKAHCHIEKSGEILWPIVDKMYVKYWHIYSRYKLQADKDGADSFGSVEACKNYLKKYWVHNVQSPDILKF